MMTAGHSSQCTGHLTLDEESKVPGGKVIVWVHLTRKEKRWKMKPGLLHPTAVPFLSELSLGIFTLVVLAWIFYGFCLVLLCFAFIHNVLFLEGLMPRSIKSISISFHNLHWNTRLVLVNLFQGSWKELAIFILPFVFLVFHSALSSGPLWIWTSPDGHEWTHHNEYVWLCPGLKAINFDMPGIVHMLSLRNSL